MKQENMKMVAISSFENSVNFQQTTWHHTPEGIMTGVRTPNHKMCKCKIYTAVKNGQSLKEISKRM
jgi:hypothetical protein